MAFGDLHCVFEPNKGRGVRAVSQIGLRSRLRKKAALVTADVICPRIKFFCGRARTSLRAGTIRLQVHVIRFLPPEKWRLTNIRNQPARQILTWRNKSQVRRNGSKLGFSGNSSAERDRKSTNLVKTAERARGAAAGHQEQNQVENSSSRSLWPMLTAVNFAKSVFSRFQAQ